MEGRYFVVQAMGGLLLMSCRVSAGDSTLPNSQEAVLVRSGAVSAPVTEHRSDPRRSRVDEPADIAELEAAEAERIAEIAPDPPPFAGRDRVRVEELFAELEIIADEMARLPAVRADYDALRQAKGLEHSEALYRDYVRVKLAFETTRDGGLWHLRWDITNEKPNSDEIWAQWKRAVISDDETPTPTAIAECDELSALFAFVARNLGVRHIGLFWPQWNHVVAVWTVQPQDGEPVRIVVPTSQIFLGAEDSLGTDGFDPWTQKNIFEYRRRDVKSSHRIDADLARFFVVQARRDAGRSQVELQRRRNARDLAMTAAEDALN